MIPLFFSISGAIGIRAGLGRETMTMDLSSIPDDALTVAIRGDNGVGKSTVLNLALVPWREPPHIPGSIYDHFGPEGLRELIWTHGGTRYRSRIEYRNSNKTRSQRAYLHTKKGGEWEPYCMPDRTVSDGKSSTYDSCLEHILGPSDIYYLSAFRAQGAAPLAEYEDPKKLMRVLLALDEPAELAARSSDVARQLHRRYDAMHREVQFLRNHEHTIEKLELAASDIDALLPELLQRKTSANIVLARTKAELERAEAENLERHAMIERRVAIISRRKLAETDYAQRKKQLHERATTASHQKSAIEMTYKTRVSESATDVAALQNRSRAADKLLLRRGDIAKAEDEAKTLALQIDTEKRAESALLDEMAEMRKIAAEADKLGALASESRKIGLHIGQRLLDQSFRADFIVRVPCGGKPPYDSCPALEDAINAKKQVPASREKHRAIIEKEKGLCNRVAILRDQTGDIDDTTRRHGESVERSRRLEKELATCRKIASERGAADQAEIIKTEAAGDLAKLHRRMDTERTAHTEKIAVLDADLANIQDDLERMRSEEAMALAAIDAELNALPAPGSDDAYRQASQCLVDAENREQDAARDIDNASASLARDRAEICSLRRELDRYAERSADAERVGIEIAEWNLLTAALRGVIDLTIEDAGPSVAAVANRLLSEAYGPRFSVRIVTQREQRNGRLVECFDVGVIDAETEIEASILHKSGGECVWIDKALSDAVGIYQQDAAGVRYECLFADEAEDGLTQERKAMFYRMDRVALKLGGYQRKYFVSHDPEAWSMADHVIDLADYRAKS